MPAAEIVVVEDEQAIRRGVADALETLRRCEAVIAPTLPSAISPAVRMKTPKGRSRRRWIPVTAALLLVLGGVTLWALNRPGRGEDNPGPDPGKPSG